MPTPDDCPLPQEDWEGSAPVESPDQPALGEPGEELPVAGSSGGCCPDTSWYGGREVWRAVDEAVWSVWSPQCPPGSAIIEVWAPGANGSAEGGGGGGAYSATTVTIDQGDPYVQPNISFGVYAAKDPGEASYVTDWNGNVVAMAKGQGAGSSAEAVPDNGGADGGDGSPSAGGSSPNGGAGGVAGEDGQSPGGGGGPSLDGGPPGAGAGGMVRITWGEPLHSLNGADGVIDISGEDGVTVDPPDEDGVIVVRGQGLENPLEPEDGGTGLDASDATAGYIPVATGDGAFVMQKRPRVKTGNGPPDDSIGHIGDIYIDLDNLHIYLPKT